MISNIFSAFFGRGGKSDATAATSAAENDAVAGMVAEGLASWERGEREAARDAFLRAASLEPDDAGVQMYLANACTETGRLDEGIAGYRRALALAPGNAGISHNLALALLARGDGDEAVAIFRQAVQADPANADSRASLLFALNLAPGSSQQDVAQAHRDWGRLVADPHTPAVPAFANTREPDRRLRIGYVSGDFHAHVAARFIQPFLRHHDRDAFEVSCYANGPLPPEAARHGHRWRDITRMDDDALAAQVRADGIDLLVDLAGHTRRNRLLAFARKPAPVQMTFLGYPNTTGMRAMDYRISDAITDPPGEGDARYTETVLRLDGCLWCFDPPQEVAASASGHGPFRGGAAPLLGSFNNIAKIGEELVDSWAEVMARLPAARMVLLTIPEGVARERLRSAFARRGVAHERIDIHGRVSEAEFAGFAARVDLALDSHPCNGGATTSELLSFGLLVLTRSGEMFASRAGASLLRAAGHPELVAQDREDFVARAVALCGDPARLSLLRESLAAIRNGSPLTDGAAYTRGLEGLYRDAWGRWCAA
jgi:protein O-GlcNAc transferase